MTGSTQLMSKMLKGPPGSPLPLCSGTSITSINPTVPFLSVPQTGQLAGPPQLFEIRTAVRTIDESYKWKHFRSHRISSNDVCRGPDCPFLKLPLTLAFSDSSCRPPSKPAKV